MQEKTKSCKEERGRDSHRQTQTDRQIYRQIERRIDRQTDRETQKVKKEKTQKGRKMGLEEELEQGDQINDNYPWPKVGQNGSRRLVSESALRNKFLSFRKVVK